MVGIFKIGKNKNKIRLEREGKGLQIIATLLMIPNDTGQVVGMAQSSLLEVDSRMNTENKGANKGDTRGNSLKDKIHHQNYSIYKTIQDKPQDPTNNKGK